MKVDRTTKTIREHIRLTEVYVIAGFSKEEASHKAFEEIMAKARKNERRIEERMKQKEVAGWNR
jgi:hydroxylamine reductase (hybrid-cluster protein)